MGSELCYDPNMNGDANVLGVELVVGRIDDALPIVTDALGWTVVYDGPSGDVAGRTVVLDAGSITVTLLEPRDHGPGILSNRTPRLTQLVVGGEAADAEITVDRLVALGLPTQSAGPTRRFVPPEAMVGVLGIETALMVQAIGEDAT